MLSFAIMALAAASAGSSPTLSTSSPWWEKVTYTFSGDGGQSCEYSSSIAGARVCDADEASSPVKAASGASGTYTKITIERRFSPANAPLPLSLESGDTLLGGQVMALAIDEAGKVSGCEVVAASGDVRPSYSCEAARAERFEASAERTAPKAREAYMTIVVYGHEEYLA